MFRMHLHLRVRVLLGIFLTLSYLFTSNKVESVSIPGPWQLLGSTFIGDKKGDQLGWYVALSSDSTVLAMSSYPDASSGGYVRVYRYVDSSWIQMGSDIVGREHTLFGRVLAMSADGMRLAVTSNKCDPEFVQSCNGYVSVYGFDPYNTLDWSIVGNVIEGDVDGEKIGNGLEMSSDGNRLVVGSPIYDGNGVDSGRVRVFEMYADLWFPLANEIPGEKPYDYAGGYYGSSISSDGAVIAVGSRYYGDTDKGRVRVFRFDGSAWIQLGPAIDGESDYDYSGSVTALSSDGLTIAIGAYYNDASPDRRDSGHARVYRFNGEIWVQLGSDIDGLHAYDQLGAIIDLSADGSTLVVGAENFGINQPFAGGSNRVRVYHYSGLDWLQVGSDIIGDPSSSNSATVRISGDGFTVAIGEYNSQDGFGSVRVFNFQPACSEMETGESLFVKSSTKIGGGYSLSLLRCAWLAKQKRSVRALYCNSAEKFGAYEPASIVCPKTCETYYLQYCPLEL